MARLAWAVLVVGAMALMTVGLWETVHFEPTSEALAAEDRGELLVLVACALLAAAAYVAHRWLGAAPWVVVAVATPIVVCGGITLTGMVAVISLVVAYPVALAGLVGGLLARS